MIKTLIRENVAATLLMVEDDVLIRMPVASYLRECGYRVIEACTSDEALQVLGEETVAIDVMLTDVEVKGSTDGFSLLQWVKKNRPHTKTLVSGTPERLAKTAGKLCEEGPTLAKPYDPQHLHNHIRRLLGTRVDS